MSESVWMDREPSAEYTLDDLQKAVSVIIRHGSLCSRSNNDKNALTPVAAKNIIFLYLNTVSSSRDIEQAMNIVASIREEIPHGDKLRASINRLAAYQQFEEAVSLIMLHGSLCSRSIVKSYELSLAHIKSIIYSYLSGVTSSSEIKRAINVISSIKEEVPCCDELHVIIEQLVMYEQLEGRLNRDVCSFTAGFIGANYNSMWAQHPTPPIVVRHASGEGVGILNPAPS